MISCSFPFYFCFKPLCIAFTSFFATLLVPKRWKEKTLSRPQIYYSQNASGVFFNINYIKLDTISCKCIYLLVQFQILLGFCINFSIFNIFDHNHFHYWIFVTIYVSESLLLAKNHITYRVLTNECPDFTISLPYLYKNFPYSYLF